MRWRSHGKRDLCAVAGPGVRLGIARWLGELDEGAAQVQRGGSAHGNVRSGKWNARRRWTVRAGLRAVRAWLGMGCERCTGLRAQWSRTVKRQRHGDGGAGLQSAVHGGN